MLRFLRIKHLAVIDSVEVEFDPGLNVLTGETGHRCVGVGAVGVEDERSVHRADGQRTRGAGRSGGARSACRAGGASP